MRIYPYYQCPKCGLVVSREKALSPPADGQQAQELPCPKDGPVIWQPAKGKS